MAIRLRDETPGLIGANVMPRLMGQQKAIKSFKYRLLSQVVEWAMAG
jgi:hypothetical protein